jgi:integrase/recombinase XerD
MLYSAGLRVSEVTALKIEDIDSKRMMLHIKGAKGKKDKMVPLSARLLDILRIYYRQYHPKVYVFEGEGGGKECSGDFSLCKEKGRHQKERKCSHAPS